MSQINRRVAFVLLSVLVVCSLVLACMPHIGARVAWAQDPIAGLEGKLYRAAITLKFSYDVTRLASLGIDLHDQSGERAVVFVDETQLATLAHRGFRPAELVEIDTLLQMAGGPVMSAAELTALESPDSDADGLTDLEEEWWGTDPHDNNSDSPLPPSATNPSDGDEVAAILNGITAYGPPFALWPQFRPYNPNGTVPDGDFDGVPDYAEEFIIGTSPLRESSDKDKFDDGQELFGVTFCPAPSGSCGYGILPRAEDAEFVSANLPAWVLPPGNSPWVAAFPMPEVEVVPSSIKMTAKTTIQTEKTITEGEEHTYGTATTTGTSSSVANTVTWNEWEEVSHTTASYASSLTLDPQFNSSIGAADLSKTLKIAGGVSSTIGAGLAVAGLFTANPVVAGAGVVLRLAGAGLSLAGNLSDSGPASNVTNIENNYVQNISGSNNCGFVGAGSLTCDKSSVQVVNNQQSMEISSVNVSAQNRTAPYSGADYAVNSQGHLTTQPVYYASWPTQFTPTTTTTRGFERGGAQTTTHTQYEEQTISESSTNQFSTSWADATAYDTAHAADLRFTYIIVNNGSEYAREVSSLIFSIYVGDDPNPIDSYVAVGATGQIASVENLFPSEALRFTSNPVALTLDEMRAIDEGAPIRIVMEDIAFGQDQAFYQDALNGSMTVAVEDGIGDGDEAIDSYLIALWDPSDTIQDVLKRYFPMIEDSEGNLTSLSTPEFDTSPPTFNRRDVSLSNWLNFYMSDSLDYDGSLKETLAKPGATVLIRILSDRDLDGYSDRNEILLSTDPDDPASHPKPELLAGYITSCDGNDCTTLMTLLNTGSYETYGVTAIMYSPDGQCEITNNTIGGSGRVPAGQQVVLGTRILSPDTKNWTGSAEPYSTGYYLGDIDRTYTFTAQGAGWIGSGTLIFNWSDDQGGSGIVDFGAGYSAPLPLDVAQGVQVGFQSGSVNAGESFTIQALTPRDTFQYTRLSPDAAEPVIVVSYNDPQGNHRFVLPSADYPDGSRLTDLNSDLSVLSGKMIPDIGVDIASTSETQANFIINAVHPITITDAYLFVEYIDQQGNVDREDVFTRTLETGPTVIPVAVDTGTFAPEDYNILAFFTDSQGNIIDSSARPLASFWADPLPQAVLTAGDWQVGTLGVQSVPDPWNFGAVESGTLLSARMTLANTGLGSLLYALTGVDDVVSVEGLAAGSLGPTETRRFDISIDTAGLPAGPFQKTLTLRTSDPNHAVIAINLTGSIGAMVGTAIAYQVNPYRPWDQYVSVEGPLDLYTTVVFSHTIENEASRMHPLYLYTEGDATLKGVGEYGVDFVGETSSYEMFGDGSDGDLTVAAGQTFYMDEVRQGSHMTSPAGQKTVYVGSVLGFNMGDEVLVIQMQGTGAGNYEFGTITDIDGGVASLTLENDLEHTYTVDASSKVQVLRVPHYRNVTVESGATLTAHAWDGNAGGVLAFKVSEDCSVTGLVDVSGEGFRGYSGYQSGREQVVSWVGQQGGGSISTGGGMSYFSNGSGGGGGGYSTNDVWAQGNGGGGGGNGTSGASGAVSGGGNNAGGPGGYGGEMVGNTRLTAIHCGGAGGSGGLADTKDNVELHSGGGGNGGAIVVMLARDFVLTGQIEANGTAGEGGVSYGAGAGGSGAGGTILIRTSEATIGSNLISALGGPRSYRNGDTPGDGDGGEGGSGRIRLEYCKGYSGFTNPPASAEKLNCYIIRQIPDGLPNDVELYLPEAVSASDSVRYVAQFGPRSEDTSGGDQTFSVRLPNRGYVTVTLSSLIERVAGSADDFNFCLDLGNDGTCDWSPAEQAFTGPVRLDTTPDDEVALAEALNAYIQSQGSTDPSLLIPIRVNIDTPADIFLFNLIARPGDDIDVSPLSFTVTPDNGALPDNISEGSLVELSATITNTGVYTAEAFTVGFYNGVPISPTESILIGSSFVESLGPAYTATVTQTWDTTGLLGPYTLYVRTDASGNVAEADESNNTQAVTVTVRSKPDLVPVSLSVPDVRAGETVSVSTVISNNGEADVFGAPVTLYEGDPDTGSAVGNIAVDVPSGGAATARIAWTPATAGLHALSVKADPADAVLEAVEDNNALSGMVRAGWDALTVDAGADPSYDVASGYGWLTEGSVVSTCGTDPENTYRQASSVESLDYRFDNLLPSRAYHLDLTFALCSGQRWVDLDVDGDPVGDSQLGLYGAGITHTVPVTTELRTTSVLLDPAEYEDGTVDLSIHRADGLGGPLVNLIDLHEIRYCYRDSGPGEAAWTAANACGHDPTWPTDVFDGWGTNPAQTVRFSESGRIKYRFTGTDPVKDYRVGLTFYEGDGQGRQQQILLDSTLAGTVTVGATAQRYIYVLPHSEYADGEVVLTIDRIGGGLTVVSEVALEEVTRRYPAPAIVVEPEPTATPPAGAPQVTLSGFAAAWAGPSVRLDWATTTEINNAAFALFRSADTHAWAEISSVPSVRPCGNYAGTDPVSYVYTDTTALANETYYYRILFSGSGCGLGDAMAIQTAHIEPRQGSSVLFLPIILKSH